MIKILRYPRRVVTLAISLFIGQLPIAAHADLEDTLPETQPIFDDVITVQVFNQELANTTYYPDNALLLKAVENLDVKTLRTLLIQRFLFVITQNLHFSPDDEVHTFGKWPRSADGLPNLYPNPGIYGDASWKWDSIFAAIITNSTQKYISDVLQATSLRRLILGIMISVIQNQIGPGLDDIPAPYDYGMIPHMNFSNSPTNEELWKLARHSSITQPALVSTGIGQLELEQDRLGLYLAAKASMNWWLDERLIDGLPFVIHSWESGMDAGRCFDSQYLPYINPGPVGAGELDSSVLDAQLGGRSNVDPQGPEQFNPLTYDVLLGGRRNLLAALQQVAILPPSERAKELFAVRNPSMAAYLVVNLEETADLALEAGDLDAAVEFAAAAEAVKQQVNDLMWDEDSGFYYSLGRVPDPALVAIKNVDPALVVVNPDGKIMTKMGSAFIPMYAGIPSKEQAIRLLQTLQIEFWPAWPIPTVSVYDIGYEPDQYWRGSTWINVNYFIIKGLMRYGELFQLDSDYSNAIDFYNIANQLCWKTFDQTAYGYFEYYPSNKQGTLGLGANFFTWSGLAITITDLVDEIDIHITNEALFLAADGYVINRDLGPLNVLPLQSSLPLTAWFYSYWMEAWCWSTSELYPFFYRYYGDGDSRNGWVYSLLGTPYIFNYNTNQWEVLQAPWF